MQYMIIECNSQPYGTGNIVFLYILNFKLLETEKRKLLELNNNTDFLF